MNLVGGTALKKFLKYMFGLENVVDVKETIVCFNLNGVEYKPDFWYGTKVIKGFAEKEDEVGVITGIEFRELPDEIVFIYTVKLTDGRIVTCDQEDLVTFDETKDYIEKRIDECSKELVALHEDYKKLYGKDYIPS